jgi:hypothetical protein
MQWFQNDRSLGIAEIGRDPRWLSYVDCMGGSLYLQSAPYKTTCIVGA